jgi:phosphoglycolate phosphatase
LDPEQALYIGDMAVDRQAGHAAGLKVLLTQFGYGPTPVAQLGAEGTLDDWSTLHAAIAALDYRPSIE